MAKRTVVLKILAAVTPVFLTLKQKKTLRRKLSINMKWLSLSYLTNDAGFQLAKDVDEIILSYILDKYKIVGIGFTTTDTRRNGLPYRSSEMCHFVCTNKISPNFINVLYQFC
jgi:hypothetical protein